MMSSQHPFPTGMLSINVFTEIDVPFSKFQPHVNFCCSYQTYQYKVAQKLLRKPKVAQGC